MSTQNGAAERESALDMQVQLLRSRVEDDLPKPAVVMITSARQADGKSLTAETLAAGFRTQGLRTALVRLRENPVEHSGWLELVTSGRYGVPVVSELLRFDDGDVTPDQLARLIEKLRGENAYTVIDAGAFLKSTPTMTLSRLVDGILLAFRVGRAPSQDDQLMFQMIGHSRVRVLGVVATLAAAGEKERRQKSAEPSSPPRKEAATPANGKPTVGSLNLMRFFRPDH